MILLVLGIGLLQAGVFGALINKAQTLDATSQLKYTIANAACVGTLCGVLAYYVG